METQPRSAANPDPVEREVRVLAAWPEFSVADVVCHSDDRGWSPAESNPKHAIIFVRSGAFRLRLNGASSVIDPSVVYFERPGDERRVAHRVGGDVCTVIPISDTWLAELLSGEPALPGGPVAIGDAVDLRHRRLLAGMRRARLDEVEARDALVALVTLVLASPSPEAGPRA